MTQNNKPNIDSIESSVIGTILIYPQMSITFLKTIKRYKFHTNTRQVFFEVLKRMYDEKVFPKHTEDFLTFKVYVTMYATDEELKKGKCTREEFQAELFNDVKFADLLHFRWLLSFMMEYSIYGEIMNWNVLKEINEFESLSGFIEKAEKKLLLFKKMYEEKEKRMEAFSFPKQKLIKIKKS